MWARSAFGLTALALACASSASAETVTFTFTGEPQTYTVPDGVVALHIVATGAPGAPGVGGAPGGFGATLAADVVVRPGAPLRVFVGYPGITNTLEGGWSFDGNSRGGAGALGGHGGGGGGGSSVQDASGRYLVFAGGGGGGGGGAEGAQPGGRGGDAGLPGQVSCATSDCGAGGGAGTASGGGAGGVAGPHAGQFVFRPDGRAGTAVDGGDGGDGNPSSAAPGIAGGGGGGGGVFGGGGGGAGNAGGGGGGGGSSFSASGASPMPNRSGVASVTITTTAPALRAAPAAVRFEPQPLAGARTKLVTVTNRGSGAASLAALRLAPHARFLAAGRGDCPQSLLPGASCRVAVTFSPRRRSAQATTLLVAGEAPGATLRIPLTAYGGSPRVSALRLARSAFRSGAGVRVTYRVDAPARTTFEVLDDRTGRRVGATLARVAVAGTNRLTFTGRAGQSPLAHGTYRLRATARNRGGTAPSASVRFRIVG